MIRSIASFVVIFFIASLVVAALPAPPQPSPAQVSATVNGNTVTVVWTNPKKWLDPVHGFLVSANVKGVPNPLVFYASYSDMVHSTSFSLPSGTYTVSVYANSSGHPTSNPKSTTVTIP